MTNEMTLSGLFVYPIKSAAGIELSKAEMSDRGLKYDRRWLLVDPSGKFMTQRQHPRMALIQVQIGEQDLHITAPGISKLTVPLMPSLETWPTDAHPVTIWKDTCLALSMGAEAEAWFTEVLGTSCQLVYMPDESDRPVRYFGEVTPPFPQVSFADAYPFLLISEASLADLNNRLADPVPMNRFRPNLVVRGCDAFAEDQWSRIQVGAVTFWVAKPCSRCKVTTVDQTTGVAGKEPLVTLATYRAWDGQIWFGQNLLPENLGTLSVGDRLQIL